MRIYIYYLISLLILLGACKSRETVDLTNMICFSSATEATRGATINMDMADLQNLGFGLWCYYTTENFDASVTSSYPNFMNRQHIIYSGTNWVYTPLKYWPLQGNLTFFAYYPYDVISSNYEAEKTPQINYTVNNIVTEQKDVMAACEINRTKDGNPVKFTFKHLLSKIGVSAKMYLDYNSPMTISQLTLYYNNNAVQSTGTFTYNTDTTSVGVWELAGDKFHSGSTELKTTATNLSTEEQVVNEHFLYLLPQTIAAEGLSLKINYTIGETTQEKTISIFSGKTLERGKSYNLILTMSLDEIMFDVIEVSEFVTADSYYTLTYQKQLEDGTFSTIATTQVRKGTATYLHSQNGITSYIPTKPIFAGWTTEQNGTTAQYKANSKYTPTANTTLYAVFEAEKYVEIGGIKWATGYLIQDGDHSCKIGDPTDGGIYFIYGSLYGWNGGTNGNGKGLPSENEGTNVTANIKIVVRPIGEATTTTYSWRNVPQWGLSNSGKTPTEYDACTYYLGPTWRTPTRSDWESLINAMPLSTAWTHESNKGLKAKDGSLYLPYSGYRRGNENETNRRGRLQEVKTNGCSTSTLSINGENSTSAPLVWAFTYGSSSIKTGEGSRYNGRPIRCIKNY